MYTYDDAYRASLEYFEGEELPANVFTNKYCLSNNNEYFELTPRDMHQRLAGEIVRVEQKKFKQPLTLEEVFEALDGFKRIIPQGSILYGCGNPYSYVTLSNCYVVESPYDSASGILKTDAEIFAIAQRRGGSGVDLSNLRPINSPCKNAAKSSSGAPSFMKRYGRTINEVGMEGRRGALMMTISVHHPDIMGFIEAKKEIADITGANISVRLTDEFLNAVKDNKEYEQRFPVDATGERKISRFVQAREIWNAIITNAHERSEPGILFWDNILRESPADCYDDYKTVCTNPCCIAEGHSHKVITKRGLKELVDITKDDEVWVEKVGQYIKTSGYFQVGEHDVFAVRFSNGEIIYITDNHKLAKCCDDGYKLTELNKLTNDDEIATLSYPYITCIESREYVGKLPIGCIEVPDYHEFVVNNVVSGNSELPLSVGDNCRLILLNLFTYVDNPFSKRAVFNYGKFYQDAQLTQRLIDDIIDLEIECLDKILDKLRNIDPEPEEVKIRDIQLWERVKRAAINGRRTGVGITALADCFAACNVKFGSKKSIAMANDIFMVLKHGCYSSSVEIAKELGPFSIFNYMQEKDNPFLNRIKDENVQINDVALNGAKLYEDMKKFGRRNIALLTCSPAGSMSILTRTTSGIEPLYERSYIRRKKVNPNDKNVKIDSTDKDGNNFQHFEIEHPKIKIWREVGEIDFPWLTANEVNWEDRVKLQAAINRHIDHAISSTVNLPRDATVDDIRTIYETAWKSGCKGITVHREGARKDVLSRTTDRVPDRPRELLAVVYHSTMKDKSFTILIGMMNEKPFEVFFFANGRMSNSIKSGRIIKRAKNSYKFISEDESVEICPITSLCSPEEEAVGRLISLALRLSFPLRDAFSEEEVLNLIAEQLEKVGVSEDMYNSAKVTARILRRYIRSEIKLNEDCPECGAGLVRKSSCEFCTSCGWSRCS